jgi:hypothetical protein
MKQQHEKMILHGTIIAATHTETQCWLCIPTHCVSLSPSKAMLEKGLPEHSDGIVPNQSIYRTSAQSMSPPAKHSSGPLYMPSLREHAALISTVVQYTCVQQQNIALNKK